MCCFLLRAVQWYVCSLSHSSNHCSAVSTAAELHCCNSALRCYTAKLHNCTASLQHCTEPLHNCTTTQLQSYTTAVYETELQICTALLYTFRCVTPVPMAAVCLRAPHCTGVLHCTALHFSLCTGVLHCTALHFSLCTVVLHCTTLHFSLSTGVLHCNANTPHFTPALYIALAALQYRTAALNLHY